uniref:Uncharacterized protein n=1 Tax=Lepeophtheirus salmonis TaxID=72036 RepID=A0A0K2U1W2_LEPSM
MMEQCPQFSTFQCT